MARSNSSQNREQEPTGVVKLWIRVSEFLRRNLMSVVVFVLTGAWLSVSWVVYLFERKAEGANIVSYAEGVWWGIVTFLTVGYGDRYPVTLGGRFFGGILMLA